MKKFLIHILILLVAAFVICNILGFISLKLLRSSEFYKPPYAVNHLNNKNLDYIVLGSSVGLTGLDTSVIDEITGLHGANLSMDDTGMSSHYLMLQHYIAQNKTPKYCVLSPSTYNYDNDNLKMGNNDYRFLMYINRPYIKDYYREFKGFKADILLFSEYMPMLGLAYYNTELFFPSLITLIEHDKRNRFDLNGNYTYPVKDVNDSMIKSRKTLTISFSNPWLKKIKSLCMQNNIQLLYYIAPMKDYKVLTSNVDTSILNFSDTLSNSALFYDDIHINSKGRNIVSKMFGKELLRMVQIQ